jgi:hypothetical protein
MANQLIYGRLLNKEDKALPNSKITLITGDITVVATTDTFTNGDFEFTVDSETSSVKFRVTTFNEDGTEKTHPDVESESHSTEDILAPDKRLILYVDAKPLSAEQGSQGPKGDTGAQGPKGDDGAPGPKGDDGTSNFIHLRYSTKLNPNGSQMFSEPAFNRLYMGILVSNNPAGSNVPSDYTWVKYIGTDGQNGSSGQNGASGQNAYVYIRFASDNLGANISSTPSPDLPYIGIYSGSSSTAPDAPDFTWSRYAGRGIQDIELQNDSLQITYTDSQTTSIDLSELNMATPKTYTVEGIVVDENGIPLYNHPVKAFHRKDNTDISLTDDHEITTSKSGEYEITITESILKENHIEQLDLVVKVYDSGNDVLISSPLVVNASTKEVVNLSTAENEFAGLKEYKFLKGRLEDKLASISSSDLDKANVITDLAKETKSSLEDVGQFVQAKKLASEYGLNEEITYGLVKNGKVNALADIFLRPTSDIKNAIQEGIDAGAIDTSDVTEASIDTFASGLRTKAVQTILNQDIGENDDLNALFSALNLNGVDDGDKREAFLNLYIEHGSNMTTFWEEVRADGTLLNAQNQSTDLEQRVEFIALTDEPNLAKQFISNGKTTQNIIQITDTELSTAITNASIDWNDRFTGETEEEKKTFYKKVILDRIENANPTGVISHKIKQFVDDKAANTNFEDYSDINNFFETNKSFKIESDNITKYIDSNPSAISSSLSNTNGQSVEVIKEREETLKNDIAGIQRLYKVVPASSRYETIKPLFDNGLKSATDIYSMGRSNFLDSAILDRNTLAEIFDRASQQASAVMQMVANHHQKFNRLVPQVIKGAAFNEGETMDGELPDLTSLFGSQDVCECTHCRSVYSPSAYLVDLLNWIKNSKTTGDSTTDNLKSILDDRRPEIENILLTCENTNTPLPYIDLVIEVLEYAIADSLSLSSANKNRQTTYSSNYLKAHPEHLDASVYNQLKTRLFPSSAPFDLFDAESKIYFEHLGINHAQLIKIFEPSTSEGKIAGIELGLNPIETNAILNVYSLSQLYDSKTESQLQNVGRLLKLTGLSYDELTALTESKYITQDMLEEPTILFNDGCDTASADINFKTTEFKRLAHFVRLQRAVKWSVEELDGVIMSFVSSNSNITGSDLAKISLVNRISKKFDISPLEAASWFADMHNESYNDAESFYNRVFINKSVNDPNQDINVKTSTGTAVSKTITQVFKNNTSYQVFSEGALPIVLAGTVLNEEELRSFSDDTDLTQTSQLSLYFRMASVKRALQMSMTDLKTCLDRYFGSTPSTFSTSTILDFIDFVENLKTLDISGDELSYILGDNTKEALFYDEEYWKKKVTDIHKELNELRNSFFDRTDGIRNWTVELINRFVGFEHPTEGSFNQNEANEFIRIFDGTSELDTTVTTGATDEQIDVVDKIIHIVFGSSASSLTLNNSSNFRTSIINKLIDTSHADYIKVDPDTIVAPDTLSGNIIKRYELIFGDADIEPLLEDTLKAIRSNIVKEAISDEFPVIREDDTLYNSMLINLSKESFITESASTVFSTYSSNCKNYVRMYTHLQKLNVIGSEQSDFLTSFTLFNFQNLAATTNMANFIAELPLVVENKKSRKDSISLFKILGEARIEATSNSSYTINTTDLEIDLLELKGWNEEYFETIIDSSYNGAIDYTSYAWYTNVRTIAETSWRSGIYPEMLKSLTNSIALDQDTAITLSNACKSKYGNEKWGEIASEFRDELRKKQRDALADYLIVENDSFRDRDDLYEYFLIDTEMDPCRMTTRIKQANSTVQLFIQRILLNLEQPAFLSEGNSKEWEWRKNYRVWEANRKVFLYPENWIEPELRDDQTPFFKEFVDEIMQSGIDNEVAIDAYHNYLTKLDNVSDLDVAQHWYDKEKDELHVIGRTKGHPHQYFYRKYVNDSHWTPWEQIELDIESGHVFPVVFKKKLAIFWVDHVLMPKEGEQIEEGKDPTKEFHTVLNWSEYKNGKWSKRKRSKEKIKLFENKHDYGKEANATYVPEIHYDNNGNEVVLRIGIEWSRKLALNGTGFQSTLMGHFVLYDYNKDVLIWEHSNRMPSATTHEREFQYRKIRIGEELDVLVDPKNPGDAYRDWNNDVNALTTDTGDVKKLLYVPHSNQQVYSHAIPSSRYIANKNIYAADPFFFQTYTNQYFVRPVLEYTPIYGIVKQYIDSSLLRTVPSVSLTKKFTEQPISVVSKERVGRSSSMSNFNFTTKASSGLVTHDGRTVSTDENGYYITKQKIVGQKEGDKKYQFHPFMHKRVDELVQKLNIYGIDALFKPIDTGSASRYRMQQVTSSTSGFISQYGPVAANVLSDYPVNNFDFTTRGGYSMYNWELFFHLPMMVATELTNNQKFEEAQKWFHFIFDPTQVITDEVTNDQKQSRFWNTNPFKTFNGETSIAKLMEQLNEQNDEMEKQVAIWRKDPFNPYAIARLRWVAFMKNVVMKYLDMLIAWGDYLFRRDSIESVNEATQVYILAGQILGRKPEMIKQNDASPKSFKTLGGLDSFSNTMVLVENAVPIRWVPATQNSKSDIKVYDEQPNTVTLKEVLYFCIPENTKLLEYWDTVADRLFKIRHCQNIEGIVRQLPLFEPPIDPAMLVRARANGLSISEALADMNVQMPYYRYGYLYQKAVELTNDVKALGGALLAALEKKDAEEITLLRTSHEKNVLKAMKAMKKKAIEEAKKSINALQKTRENTEERRAYYASKKRVTPREKQQINKINSAFSLNTTSQTMNILAKAVTPIPAITASVGTLSGITTEVIDGEKLGRVIEMAGQGFAFGASAESHMASILGIRAGHDNRYEDYKFQAKQAALELKQLDVQLESAEIRQAIAEVELDNHILQMENNAEIGSIMKDKFSNYKLYGWMVKEISSIYFKAYQLAYDTAKKAELAYKYDVGYEDNKQYVQFGSWDNLKKGLLSGERLLQDLRNLDNAFTENNRRKNELTKQVSLANGNPMALTELQEKGTCEFDIPELLFDLDHPGHYMRRIKAVTVSIPAVTGPYTGVTGKLKLKKNRFRKNTDLIGSSNDIYKYSGNYDSRFHHMEGGTETIATSSGVNDSGMFEMNFNDARFLPFEGAGAISSWSFELPFEGADSSFRKFDYSTISDLIVTIHYTAKDGGDSFKDSAESNVKASINYWLNEALSSEEGLYKAFSMKHDFPTEFHQFMHPSDNSANHESVLNIKDAHFPYALNEKVKNTGEIALVLKLKNGYEVKTGFSSSALQLTRANDPGSTYSNFHSNSSTPNPVTLNKDTSFGDQPTVTYSNNSSVSAIGSWKLVGSTTVSDLGDLAPSSGTSPVDSNNQLLPEAVEDIILIMNYKKA